MRHRASATFGPGASGCDGLYLLEEAQTRNLLGNACVFMIVSATRCLAARLAAELEPDGYLIRCLLAKQLRMRLDRCHAPARRRSVLRGRRAFKQNDLLVAINSCNDRISRR